MEEPLISLGSEPQGQLDPRVEAPARSGCAPRKGRDRMHGKEIRASSHESCERGVSGGDVLFRVGVQDRGQLSR